MKPTIHILTSLRENTAEDGRKYFTGTIDPKEIRKLGKSQVPVVIVPKTDLPLGVVSLLDKGGNGADLLMFAEATTDKPSRSRTRSSSPRE